MNTSRHALLALAILSSFASACGLDGVRPAGTGATNQAGSTNGSTETAVETMAGQAVVDAAVPNDAGAVGAPARDASAMGAASVDAAVISGSRSDAGAASGARDDAAVTSAPRGDAAADSAAAQDGATKALVELTDTELEALCTWVEDLHLTPSKVQLCTSRSLQATSQAACNANVAACVASGNVAPPARQPCDASFVHKLPSHCAALSLQEYRGCAAAAAEASNQRLMSLSCSQLDSPRTAPPTGTLPGCETLVRVCPEVAPEGSGAPSTWSGGSFLCEDGWPLFMNEVCNGVPDCVGGEDEKSCPK